MIFCVSISATCGIRKSSSPEIKNKETQFNLIDRAFLKKVKAIDDSLLPRQKNVYVFVSSTCGYCIRDISLYKNFIYQTSGNINIQWIFVLSDPLDVATRFLNNHGIYPAKIFSCPLKSLVLKRVPQLVIVDEDYELLFSLEGQILNTAISKISEIIGAKNTSSDQYKEQSLLDTSGNQDSDLAIKLSRYKIREIDIPFITQQDFNLLDEHKTIILDISERELYQKDRYLKSRNIPLDELGMRAKRELNISHNIIIVSKDLISSCLAWEILTKKGFLNVNVLRTN
jgi:hypothetical protein